MFDLSTEPVVGPTGDLAHPMTVAVSTQFTPMVHQVHEKVFCAVGYGISNTTLVLGPTGAVIIDSGECREQLEEALDAFGDRLDRPVVGVIYTHSHYVWGTAALHDRGHNNFEVWAHQDLEKVIAEVGGEIRPAYLRRAKVQFSYYLPDSGPDSMSNVGTGPFFFSKGKKTPGFIAPTHHVPRGGQPIEIELAGLKWRMAAFDSDSDDTIVIEIPKYRTVINNHVWPALYNVYTLRGERYRDPLGLLEGFKFIRGLNPEFMSGTHGLPIIGAADCTQALDDHCDSIQFMWDQTVRQINAGCPPDELTEAVRFPERLQSSPWIRPVYGEMEYHVRQIYNGLFGWFGNDTATLHPVPSVRRAQLLVEGFGGRQAVLDKAEVALTGGEPNWTAELMSHLLRLDPEDSAARQLKANSLRVMAQHTTAANTRSQLFDRSINA